MEKYVEANRNFDYLFKIVLIGDSGVGKSNLLSQLIYNKFLQDSRATIGVEFGTMTFNIDDKVIKAQIWDTAGQERYQAITHAYYRGSYGGILVYDISSMTSYKKATEMWLSQLKNYTDFEMPIMLIGNKRDLIDEREVETNFAEDECMKNNLIFFETSAKTGENVESAFFEFIKVIYRKQKEKEAKNPKIKVQRNIKKTKEIKNLKVKKRGGCC